jgi:hypothetical protein
MVFGTSLNPGKPLRENPAIVRDRNGSLRLEDERLSFKGIFGPFRQKDSTFMRCFTLRKPFM